MGDFNQVTNSLEKKDGNSVSLSKTRKFVQAIQSCEWIDMGFSGPMYTWSNLRKSRDKIQEHIDRAFCNHSWLTLFLNCSVIHLSRSYYDHRSLLIGKTNLTATRDKRRVFQV